MRILILVFVLILVSGCGDPPQNIPKSDPYIPAEYRSTPTPTPTPTLIPTPTPSATPTKSATPTPTPITQPSTTRVTLEWAKEGLPGNCYNNPTLAKCSQSIDVLDDKLDALIISYAGKCAIYETRTAIKIDCWTNPTCQLLQSTQCASGGTVWQYYCPPLPGVYDTFRCLWNW